MAKSIQFKVLDLFSGAGGLSVGLEMLPQFKTVVATDFMKDALDTLTVNFPETTNHPSQDYINSWKREFEGKIKFLLAQIGFLKAEVFYTDGQFAKITMKEIDNPSTLS